MKRHPQRTNTKRTVKQRLLAMAVLFALFFVVLIGRVAYVQLVRGQYYASKQTDEYSSKTIIKAKRGDIYDANMLVLAKDSTSYIISVQPSKVEDASVLAKQLSEKLEMDYQTVYDKISDPTKGVQRIKTKVDNSVAAEIRELDLAGVIFEEDQKRYYTNGNFASHLLGFTGTDHNGLYGLEFSYDDILSGTDGVEITTIDGAGNELPSATQIRKEAQTGSSIVLTLDSVIQHYTQSAIEKGMSRTGAKRVTAIVMDPNTGQILAMASTPSFDLNHYDVMNETFEKNFADDFYTVVDGKKTAMTEDEKLQFMWQNPAVSLNYEPGSTFKIITASAAMEEGVVSSSSTFYCSGSKTINGTRIKCHVYPNGHGSQTLEEAISNSCNVAFMDIGARLGPDAFFEYVYNYGYGNQTGISLPGEESGSIPKNSNINAIDFATMAFGQGISVTPIQMVTALCASVNGGTLYKPMIVKQVLDTDTKEALTQYEPQVVRKVISEETSAVMCDAMYLTAKNTYGLSSYVKSIKIGGKTGTAQKFIDGQYSMTRVITSFFGFAPYDDPQYAVLVLLDEPESGYGSGSVSAAPIAGEILSKVISYYNTKNQTASADTSTTPTTINVPDVRSLSVENATQALDARQISYTIEGDLGGTIVKQSIYNVSYEDQVVVLTASGEVQEGYVAVPDFTGMSVQNANEIADALGLEFSYSGGGLASSQSVKAGSIVKKGTQIQIVFKYIR